MKFTTTNRKILLITLILTVVLALIPADLRNRASGALWQAVRPAATCNACWGSGECPSCSGTGKSVGGEKCTACDGTKDCYVCSGKGTT